MNHPPQAKPRRLILFADLPGRNRSSIKPTMLSSMLQLHPTRSISPDGRSQVSFHMLSQETLRPPIHWQSWLLIQGSLIPVNRIRLKRTETIT
jgi:hypothetical protein